MEGIPTVEMMSLDVPHDVDPVFVPADVAVAGEDVADSPNPASPSLAPGTVGSAGVATESLRLYDAHCDNLFRPTSCEGQWVCVLCRPEALTTVLAATATKTTGFCTNVRSKSNHQDYHRKRAAAERAAIERIANGDVTNDSSSLTSTVAARGSPAHVRSNPKQNYEYIKRMWVENMISFVAIESPNTRNVLAALAVPPVSRQKLRDDIVADSKALREEIIKYMLAAGGTVIIMIDAGTVLRRSFVNITVATVTVTAPPLVVFWRAFEPKKQLKQQVIRKIVMGVLDELRGRGVKVIGCVADNASNMQNAIDKDRRMILDGETLALTQAEPTEDAVDEATYDEVEELEDHPLVAPDAPIQPVLNEAEFEKFVTEVRGTKGRMFYALRCWAHTFQLILHDAASVPVVKDVFDFLSDLSAEMNGDRAVLKLEMKKFCHDAKIKFHEPTRPCDTRWNSHLVFLKYVVENHKMIHGAMLKCKSTLAKKMEKLIKNCMLVAIALNPIGIATDMVQSDSCTLTQALVVYETMVNELQKTDDLAWNDTGRKLQDELKAIVTQVHAFASRRKLKNLESNSFVFVVKYLSSDATVPRNKVNYDRMLAVLSDYSADFNVPLEELTDELQSFHNKTSLALLPNLAWVLKLAENVLVTEAAVERSFHTMVKIARPERNRMSDATLDSTLFSKFNLVKWEAHNDALRHKTVKPREKLHEIHHRLFTPKEIHDVVHTLNFEHAAKPTSHVNTRGGVAREAAALNSQFEVKAHSMLFVGYDVAGRPGHLKWYRAMALEAPNAKGTVKVLWPDDESSTDVVELAEGNWHFATRSDPRRPPQLQWETSVLLSFPPHGDSVDPPGRWDSLRPSNGRV